MDRIILRNDQQTTIAIAFAREAKTAVEVGDTIAISSSKGSIVNATFNPVTGLVDIIPIDGAIGSSDVTITATLADGVVLPAQVIGFDVQHPDADAVVLTPGEIVDKTVSIPMPIPDAPPVVVAEAEPAAKKSEDKSDT